MLKEIAVFSVIATALIGLNGCSSPKLQAQINKAYQNNQKVIGDVTKNNQQGSYVVSSGRYVDTSAHVVEPAWMHQHVVINANSTPLNQVMSILVAGTNLKVTYADDTNHLPISINYSGDLKGALDQIMQKNNIYYDIDSKQQNHINWSENETKTLQVAYLPGTTSFNISSESSTGSDSGSHSTLKGDLKGWQEIQAIISKLLSKTGRYETSQSTSTITIIDKPYNIDKIAKYVKMYNKELSKRVTIKVKILEVTLDKQHQYGIDWNVIHKGLSLGGMTGNTVASLSGYALGQSSGGVSTTSTSNSNWSGSSALIQALDQQGKTSVVDEPTITTLNNQPSTISDGDNQAYIKSSNATLSNTGGSPIITYSVTQDNIKTGLKLTLIPHIQNNHIYLSIDGSLSSLKSLKTKSFGYQQSINAITVELPDVASKDFNQRVMANNNHIIILSGLRTDTYKSQDNKNFKTTALGSNGQQVQHKELVVLIQPHILGK